MKRVFFGVIVALLLALSLSIHAESGHIQREASLAQEVTALKKEMAAERIRTWMEPRVERNLGTYANEQNASLLVVAVAIAAAVFWLVWRGLDLAVFVLKTLLNLTVRFFVTAALGLGAAWMLFWNRHGDTIQIWLDRIVSLRARFVKKGMGG